MSLYSVDVMEIPISPSTKPHSLLITQVEYRTFRQAISLQRRNLRLAIANVLVPIELTDQTCGEGYTQTSISHVQM
jgi:hypothetical protein